MSDAWDERKKRTRKALRLGPLEADPAFDQSAYRGVLMPSFHADVAITVLVDPYESHLELAVLTVEGREPLDQPPTSHLRADREEEPSELRWWRARFLVPKERAAAFARHMSTLHPVTAPDAGWLALDGLDVEGTIIDARGTTEFESRGSFSSGEAAQHTFFGSLHQLAFELAAGADDARSEAALESLHGYLGLGLPLRDCGGLPRRVRIFGRLTAHDEVQLGTALDALNNGEPLLLDMSNFEGMGTVLYPLFATFGSRSGPLVFCASPHARFHLEALGIAPEVIFDRIEDALAALGEGGA